MTQIFLTKMELNLKCPQVRRDLGSPQELHRTVSRGFRLAEEGIDPSDTPRNKYNILHRLEIDRGRTAASLLIQAIASPDWSDLPNNYALKVSQKTIHEQYSMITDGMRFFFRLQANPSKRDKSKFSADKPSQRKRFAIMNDGGRIEWLRKKGVQHGFSLGEVRVGDLGAVFNANQSKVATVRFRKNGDDRDITIASVVFDGVLQVTDVAVFKKALIEGIGPGKAYGFGLLSIALFRG